jgi:hypothetical protein
VFQGTIITTEDGAREMSDFFAEFKESDVPNEVHRATHTAASAFLSGLELGELKELTMREIIARMLKFKSPALCWKLLHRQDSTTLHGLIDFEDRLQKVRDTWLHTSTHL